MCLGASPPTPAPPVLPPEAPPPATPTDREVKRKRESVRQQAALAGGRGSTILTSPLGLTDEATTAPKTLLGA
jgi:hypothetical protein